MHIKVLRGEVSGCLAFKWLDSNMGVFVDMQRYKANIAKCVFAIFS